MANNTVSFKLKIVDEATGSTKMYYSEAAGDPEYQRNKINFRHRFICMPKKADAGVVMCSGYQALGCRVAERITTEKAESHII